MRLTGAIQEALIAVLCYDSDPAGALFVRGLVPIESYDPYYRDLAEAAAVYIDQHHTPPGEHTLDLVDQLCSIKADSAKVYRRIFDSLESIKAEINREYVIGKAKVFVRSQKIRAGVADLLDCLERDDETGVNDADGVLSRLREETIDLFDPGTFLHERSALWFLDHAADVFPTGIPQLDNRDLGPSRKTLHVFAAPLKRGKSWWLNHLAKMSWLAGYRVLVVTLEMGEDEWAKRLFQSLFSISKSDSTLRYLNFSSDPQSGLEFQEVELKGRPTLRDEGIRELLQRKQEFLRRRPKLLIKQFPSGKLTARQLEAYLNGLEAVNFLPDLVLVDYADLMDFSDYRDPRIGVGRTYVDLRGIAVERNIGMATASQTNRPSLKAKLITEGYLADDISKGQTCDTLITHNQTPGERFLNLARLYVAAARGDADKFQFVISQCYDLGQFCLASHSMAPTYFAEVKEWADDEGEDNE